MTLLESLQLEPSENSGWTEKSGCCWMNRTDLDVRTVAKAMRDAGARFITITACQLPASEGFRLEYHWDLAGRLLGFAFAVTEGAIASIVDLCAAADWIEREVHEEYAIDFIGRAYEPLLLREGQTPGVNLREAPAEPGSLGPKETVP